jgi:hypothetical protein
MRFDSFKFNFSENFHKKVMLGVLIWQIKKLMWLGINLMENRWKDDVATFLKISRMKLQPF